MPIKKNLNILILACATFLFFGMATAGIGPVLPELAEKAAASYKSIGGVISALFFGALLSNLTAGPVCDRIGHKKVLITSLIILSAGLVLFTNMKSLWLIIGLTFFAGLGHGAVDLTTNLLVARVFQEKNVSIMNVLHFFFGAGAFIGPAMVSLAIKLTGSGLIVLWVTAGAMLIIALIYLRIGGLPEVQNTASEEKNTAVNVYRTPLVWVFGLLLLLHVGVENGMGGWTTTFTHLTTGALIETGALITAGFWGLLTIGRLVTAAIGIKLSSGKILFISLALSGAGGLLLAIGTGNLVLTIIAVLLIGFSMGSVYPTVMAIITSRYPENPGKAASICAALGSVGGVTVPWVQGYIMDDYSPLSSAIFVAVIMLVMILIVFLLIRMMQPKRVVSPAK